jgi:hypothetical protein
MKPIRQKTSLPFEAWIKKDANGAVTELVEFYGARSEIFSIADDPMDLAFRKFGDMISEAERILTDAGERSLEEVLQGVAAGDLDKSLLDWSVGVMQRHHSTTRVGCAADFLIWAPKTLAALMYSIAY